VNLRLHFNERFLYLRELKKEIITAVKKDNARIHEIDAELSDPMQSSDLWEPDLNPKEVCVCVCVCVYVYVYKYVCVCMCVNV
jgi:hypothetical protein